MRALVGSISRETELKCLSECERLGYEEKKKKKRKRFQLFVFCSEEENGDKFEC